MFRGFEDTEELGEDAADGVTVFETAHRQFLIRVDLVGKAGPDLFFFSRWLNNISEGPD